MSISNVQMEEHVLKIMEFPNVPVHLASPELIAERKVKLIDIIMDFNSSYSPCRSLAQNNCTVKFCESDQNIVLFIDPCYNYKCANGGTCVADNNDRPICNCLSGFSGNHCEKRGRINKIVDWTLSF